MLRIALRNLWDHKLRTTLLGLAVVAGVGFVTASYVFTDSLSAAFDDAFAAGAEGIDIQVLPSPEEATSAAGGGEFPRFPATVVDDVAAVDGVEAATPALQGFVTIVVEGQDQQPFGAPDFGINWSGSGPFELIEGAAPAASDEAVIDAASAESLELAVGDTLRVAGTGRARTFTLVGTFGFGGGGAGFGGATFVAFTLDTITDLLGVEDEVNGVEVAVAPGVDSSEVLADVQGALPSGVQALDAREAAEQQAAELQEGISFFNTFLLVFGAIALVVGAFVVYNAFRVVVAQRSRELALLRILGTTRRQLVGSVLGEALVVGAIASVVGVGAGLALAVVIRWLLAATGGELPDAGLVLAARTVLVGVGVGMVTTIVSAIVPAARTARISPMEALRDQPELKRVKPWWAWVGGAIMVVAAVFVAVGVVQAGDEAALTGDTDPLVLIGIGCGAAFAGLFLLARALSRPVIGVLGSGARSTAATLGRENARRTPRRTAVTASALMIGLGLVATVAVLSRSVEDTILGAVDDAFASDFVVTQAGFSSEFSIPVEVGDVVAEVDGVDSVARLNAIEVELPDGSTTLAAGAEPETIELSVSFEDVEGSFQELGPGTVAVQQIEAENRGYALGDTIDLGVGGEPFPVEVVAIFDLGGDVSDSQSYYLAYDVVADLRDEPRDFTLSVAIDDGADLDMVVASTEDALADFPSVQVSTVSDLADQVRSALNGVLGLVAGLLLMSVAVAVVGIVLTLYLAVYERTRETGMLRAVGMTRRQVRRMIRFESIMVAVFGTLLGIVLGLVCGWALSIGIVGEGVRFSIPWVWLVSGLVGALVAGVVAAIIPARRAARMDVLEAIAYE